MTNYLYDQMYLMNLQVICQKIQKDIQTDIITFHPLVASIDNSIQVIHYLNKKKRVCLFKGTCTATHRLDDSQRVFAVNFDNSNVL